jgi:hypothetical protein
MKRASIFLIAVALIVCMPGCFTPFRMQYQLTLSSTEGGKVTNPGEGTFTYWGGTVVDLVAEADDGHCFINWTGDACACNIANINAASTTITVNNDYSIIADFGELPAVQYQLAINSTEGGNVTAPGIGVFTYDEGTVVNLIADADEDYQFVEWTGNVSTVADVNAAATNITMNGSYNITANFVYSILLVANSEVDRAIMASLA